MIPIASKLLSDRRRRMAAGFLAGVMALTTFFGYTAYAYGEKTVTVVINGKKRTVDTNEDTVKGLLVKELHLSVDAHHDKIRPGLDAKLDDHMTVVWDPAHRVVIDHDGTKRTEWTTADTVGELVGKQLVPHDVVKPGESAAITDGMVIRIQDGIQVTVTDGTRPAKTVWTVAMKPEAFLKKQGIAWDENDRIETTGAGSMLKDGAAVKVIRVEHKTVKETEPIAYKVEKRKDASLPKGQTRLIQAGREGEAVATYDVTIENGKEVKKELVRREVKRPSQNEILAVGTQPSGTAKVLTMRSSAYTADCKGCGGVTTTGINLKRHPGMKVIAVDPQIIPLGTRVYVEGYGYAIAADTGGGIHGHRIDVFFPSESQAVAWGLRTVQVKILD
ncbi:G5 and 3D domain-containing protein [Caenibacillus caldisaponilyticus]|uniref:G5 and 3D domain-containing protein n=1 Tax=Caenibacillus caldisaponilyticus TaxID=1674942 RepID=UPI0009885929|nr:G5 and 3D domain-containing protein [Caenibacillus caldisaponilyticus]